MSRAVLVLFWGLCSPNYGDDRCTEPDQEGCESLAPAKCGTVLFGGVNVDEVRRGPLAY